MIAIGLLLVAAETYLWHVPILSPLGEAIFIAGLLGFTVDRLLKAKLVREVADQVLRNLWGAGAPQEYLKNLNESLSTYSAIILNLQLRVTLKWQNDNQDRLKVTYEARSVKQNVSADAWKPSLPWVPSSLADGPESQILRLELIIRHPPQGQRAPIEVRKEWTARQLHDARRMSDRGVGLVEDFASSNGIPYVNPGEICEARCVAVRYRHADDVMPLWTNAPALSWQLDIDGPALDDLEVHAYLGAEDIDLDGQSPLHGVHGFSHAGATLRVTWVPKSPQDHAPEEGGGQPAT
ncbi:hypothetical protein [Streptomyces platensis]|uniref:hypothetical protein n=1 Tax=Streptomyces platensis TaxID=58346 RepID=UPI002E8009FE|nr:hypothetical protein [Streptomyces platensis]WUB81428.1 hypothetical protein OG424_20935 [Streptomyces platensis]